MKKCIEKRDPPWPCLRSLIVDSNWCQVGANLVLKLKVQRSYLWHIGLQSSRLQIADHKSIPLFHHQVSFIVKQRMLAFPSTTSKGAVYEEDDTVRTPSAHSASKCPELNSCLSSSLGGIRKHLSSSLRGILKHSTQAASLESSYTNASKTKSASIQFSTIAISSHLIILGHNPSTSQGPPVSLSWKAIHTQTLALEDYEDNKPAKRTRDQLLLPRAVREDWLIALGYSRQDLKLAEKQVAKIQKSRSKSAVQRPSLLESLQSLGWRQSSSAVVPCEKVSNRYFRSSYPSDLTLNSSI
jgi:hypothetical protein